METGEYYMRKVAGTGCVEQMVAGRLKLPGPAQEILEWRKSVIVQQAESVCGGAVLTGHLRTRCLFVTAPRPARPPVSRIRSAAVPQDTCGRVLLHTAEIPFTLHIPVPGAAAGMPVAVTSAHVLADSSRALLYNRNGHITELLDQSLIVATVRVVEPDLVPVHKEEREPEQRIDQSKRRPDKRRRRHTARKPDGMTSGEKPAEAASDRAPSRTWVHPSASVQFLRNGR